MGSVIFYIRNLIADAPIRDAVLSFPHIVLNLMTFPTEARSRYASIHIAISINSFAIFRHRDSNPGRSGEGRVSQPARLQRTWQHGQLSYNDVGTEGCEAPVLILMRCVVCHKCGRLRSLYIYIYIYKAIWAPYINPLQSSWLGYSALTRATRVRVPVAELPSGNSEW